MNDQPRPAAPQGLQEAPASFTPAPDAASAPDLQADELRGRDLRGRDLTKAEGLLPEHLAGADLTRAKLPPEIEKFPALEQVKAISSEARKIFIALLAACVYSWLVIGTTTDVALLLNTASSPLPIINTAIPIAGFYVIGGFVLAAVYCYLHFYLQWLWRALATLPANFPDGVALDDKTDPWLLTNLVGLEFKPLSASAPPLARLENLLAVFLTWWLVPLTLFALWARYLPAHGWLGTSWLVFLIFLATHFGRHTYRLARDALRGRIPQATDADGGILARALRELRSLRPDKLTGWLTIGLIVCSFSAFRDNPRAPHTWVAKSLNAFDFIGIRTYANLREIGVAQKPEGWDGKNWNEVKRVDLRGRNLAFADLTGAFLGNADLRGADLHGADLTSAEFQGADLARANLEAAYLSGAQFQEANLASADLRFVDFSRVALQGANLQEAHLQGALLTCRSIATTGYRVFLKDGCTKLYGANFSNAEMQGVGLVAAELEGAVLAGANLQGANLQYADLRGADLSCVRQNYYTQNSCLNLRGANLRGADLRLARINTSGVMDGEWQFADVRVVNAALVEDIQQFRNELSKTTSDQYINTDLIEMFTKTWTDLQSGIPTFPTDWDNPDVMFDASDPIVREFRWGEPRWTTNEAYQKDRADALAEIACGAGGATDSAKAFALGVLDPRFAFDIDQTYARRLGERLTDAKCLSAKRLPNWIRRQLQQLAAGTP